MLLAVIIAGAVLLALLLVELVHRLVLRASRRSALAGRLADTAHRPFQVTMVLCAAWVALRFSTADFSAKKGVTHAVGTAAIIGFAWLATSTLLATEEAALRRVRTDVPDNRRARRIQSQVVMLRRITIAIIMVLAAGTLLLTFPPVRAIGASLLASAGIIGIVTALAAQSVLGNAIAGLQLAFSDAVRLDDVVVVEGEWGRIEEITLSHVVIQIWDDRRLILPTNYFTTQPFQNWTKSRSELLGTVEFDVDWTAPVPELREELRRLVEGTHLWDGRVCVLQVVDAVGGSVRLRALVSSTDAPSSWDLRCLVREHLVAWMRDHSPRALPRDRIEFSPEGLPAERLVTRWSAEPEVSRPGPRRGEGWNERSAGGPAAGAERPVGGAPAHPERHAARPQPHPAVPPADEVPTHDGEPADGSRVFGGSDDGDERSSRFTGPEHQPREPGHQADTTQGWDRDDDDPARSR